MMNKIPRIVPIFGRNYAFIKFLEVFQNELNHSDSLPCVALHFFHFLAGIIIQYIIFS
uniref:Uncharacterized protein n=1 Tax=Anguilla anguilla TaxID=7936 RepID=A0A0E9TWW6_ANGAN